MTSQSSTAATTNVLWLSPEVLQWPARAEGGQQFENAFVRAPYKHWEHAERVCKAADTKLHRVDVVSALKRAIDFRIKRLNELYQFKRIPHLAKQDGIIEFLASVGVIRPLILEKILTIRNRIEHQDADPPNLNECLELVDFAWYFLRSTDELVRTSRDGYVLDPEEGFYESFYGITVRTGPRSNWNVDIAGWVPGEWVSDSKNEEWLRVEYTVRENPADVIARSSTNERGGIMRSVNQVSLIKHSQREKTDTWLIGKVKAPTEALQSIVARYFQS